MNENNYEELVQKLTQEHKELKQKIERLADFIGIQNSGFYNLPDTQQFLLKQQYNSMVLYDNILQFRTHLIVEDHWKSSIKKAWED